MTGKNCVALACDTRFGIQLSTIATDFNRIARYGDKTLCGFSGLISDVQTLHQTLAFRTKLYELREERQMKVSTFANLISTLLYEKRFGPYFCEPVVAGLRDVTDEKTSEVQKDVPFICAMDLIGAPVFTDDFVVGGTSSEELYGTCEAMYKKDMDSEQLFETVSQALLSAVDRDCLAGWGAIVYIITPTECITRTLKGRMD